MSGDPREFNWLAYVREKLPEVPLSEEDYQAWLQQKRAVYAQIEADSRFCEGNIFSEAAKRAREDKKNDPDIR